MAATALGQSGGDPDASGGRVGAVETDRYFAFSFFINRSLNPLFNRLLREEDWEITNCRGDPTFDISHWMNRYKG